MPNALTIRELLRTAADRFAASDSPLLDAQVLLCHVLGWPRSRLVARPGETLTKAQGSAFGELVEQRARGVPVAYLTGEREFWSLDLKVTADTLIPRPDTETLVARALEIVPPTGAFRVVDLGTGSGAIALAIASERPDAKVTATDRSAAALAVAESNAGRHGLDRVRFLQGDWFAPLNGERFDLIVSNPPYVESADPCLANGDTAHEPRTALSAGRDGLDALRVLAASAPAALSSGGTVLLEHGCSQASAVAALLQDAGLTGIQTHHDLAGLARCTEARRLN